jgi:hypothetical protein
VVAASLDLVLTVTRALTATSLALTRPAVISRGVVIPPLTPPALPDSERREAGRTTMPTILFVLMIWTATTKTEEWQASAGFAIARMPGCRNSQP